MPEALRSGDRHHVNLVLLELFTICAPMVGVAAPSAAVALSFAASAASAFAVTSFALSFAPVSFLALAAFAAFLPGAEVVEFLLEMGLPLQPFGFCVLPVLVVVLVICGLQLSLPLGRQRVDIHIALPTSLCGSSVIVLLVGHLNEH